MKSHAARKGAHLSASPLALLPRCTSAQKARLVRTFFTPSRHRLRRRSDRTAGGAGAPSSPVGRIPFQDRAATAPTTVTTSTVLGDSPPRPSSRGAAAGSTRLPGTVGERGVAPLPCKQLLGHGSRLPPRLRLSQTPTQLDRRLPLAGSRVILRRRHPVPARCGSASQHCCGLRRVVFEAVEDFATSRVGVLTRVRDILDDPMQCERVDMELVDKEVVGVLGLDVPT